MSPSKFQESGVARGVINGPRPQPLTINKDSHFIQKPSSHKPAAAAKSHGQPAAKRQPIIIYTHSPKVIHARPCDFMAIVQSLTGPKRDDSCKDKAVKSSEETVKEENSYTNEKDCGGVNNNVGYLENNETTSVLYDDQRFMGDVKHDSMYKMSNTFLVDTPLFTPNPSEFFCSARPTAMLHPPSISPSSYYVTPLSDF